MRFIDYDTGFVYVMDGGKEYIVSLSDGTKFRRVLDPSIIPEYPESIDLKITNKCITGCAWCHESSTPVGEHADYDWLMRIIDSMPIGLEVAIGGGDPLLFPKLKELLQTMKYKGIIPSLTINSRSPHSQDDINHLSGNVYGVGLSVPGHFDKRGDKYVTEKVKMLVNAGIPIRNIVLHGIISINTPEQLLRLAEQTGVSKILILGYKSFGFGKTFLKLTSTGNLKRYAPGEFKGLVTVAYDTLAVEQIGLSTTSEYYMGNEGTHSFYIDAVNEQFAKSSYSTDRYDAKSLDIREMFAKLARGLS